jgi:hypothetical protein
MDTNGHELKIGGEKCFDRAVRFFQPPMGTEELAGGDRGYVAEDAGDPAQAV